MKNTIFLAALVAALSVDARPYHDPQPSWPPRPFTDLNGRKLEFFAHGARPEWGYADANREDHFAVVHSKDDKPGAPLVVVLHSAGHDLVTAMRCVRQVGNHDIYTVPDFAFALYLDCAYSRGRDWWWGCNEARDRGFEESPLERRVLATIDWVLSEYKLDRDRVYLCGNSMGAAGTLGIGLRHGDVFAAVKANTPAGIAQALGRLAATNAAPPAIPEPPVCVDYSAQNDKWSAEHERLISLMRARKYNYVLFWGAFGHANDDSAMDRHNDVIRDFDWLAVRRNEPYPVFLDASSDSPSPWPIRVADGKAVADDMRPGQINGFFRWRNVSQSARRLEMDLSLARPKTKFRELEAPAAARAKVALRRLGAFRPAAGAKARWSFGGKSGEISVGGIVELPELEIVREPRRLTLETP